jgi:protein involved in polysaccharide export with SLBB domain
MAPCRRIAPLRPSALVPFLLAVATVCLAFPKGALPLGGPKAVTASIGGEVRRPGNYTLPPGSTLSSLLIAAGGFTDNAFPGGAILRRASARAAQESELRETASRLYWETAATGETRDAARPVVLLLRTLAPSGRAPVRLSHPRLLKGSPADLPLEEGDALSVPPKADTVAVAGAVRADSASVPFTADLPYKEYIRRAGGYAGGADRGDVYLLRADGTVALLSLGFVSWNPAASRWEVTALAGTTPAVSPGDTIVVLRPPPKGLPPKAARELPGILMRAAEIAAEPVTLP